MLECIDTNWVSTAGAFVEKFESKFAEFVGASHAVAVSSGTAALHLALLTAGVKPDDEVIVPALTFIAPANAIRYVGAWPLIVDVESDSWQLNPALVSEYVSSKCEIVSGELRNRKSGRRVSAILPVHILGHSVNLEPLKQLASQYKLALIEDSTESLGAKYSGQSTGTIGEFGCFSFNGNKLITTGGGGMVVTSNQKLADRVRYLSTQAKDDPLEYKHGEVGYNYRLTNVQAALGVAQLEQIEGFIEAKRAIASRYEEAFSSIDGLSLMPNLPWNERMPWLYTVLIDPSEFGISSRNLIEKLAVAGVQARPLWEPMSSSRVHSGGGDFDCPVAESLYERAISLPSSSNLSQSDQQLVIDAVLGAASGS